MRGSAASTHLPPTIENRHPDTASPRHAAFRPWPLRKRVGKRGATAVPSETFNMWRDLAPRRLFRAYLPFYPERRRWPPEVAFRRLLRGALPSLCQWAPRGRNAPQGIQAAPPETAATLATARRHRSLPTQSPSRPVFPWEELGESVRGFPGRGINEARGRRRSIDFAREFLRDRAKWRGFIPASGLRRLTAIIAGERLMAEKGLEADGRELGGDAAKAACRLVNGRRRRSAMTANLRTNFAS